MMTVGPIISADDHLQEPPDLWLKRLPPLLRERAPRLADLPGGGQGWQVPGQPLRPLGILVMAGKRSEELRDSGLMWGDVRPGCYKPAARLADMDADGIQATVLYPNVCLDFFMGQSVLDPDVAPAAYAAYNDHLSEFCLAKPDRLFGVGLVPTHTAEEAVGELRRLARMPGIRGALLPVVPAGGADWNDPRYEPIWATAAGAGLPLSIHAGKPRGLPPRHEIMRMPGGGAIYMHIGPFSTAETFAHVMWTGVFDRHPTLRMVSVEGGIGWLAFFKERAELVFHRHRHWIGSGLRTGPGEWFGRNFFATFERDPIGVRCRDVIGVETMLWASDYPHSETSWPRSQQSVAEAFQGVPEAEVRQIVHDNAVRLYGIR